MRVAVLHHSLNSCGGGERLCLATIEALQEAGHEVILATTEPTDWSRVEEAFGKRVRPDEEHSILPFSLKLFGIYQRQLTSLWAYRLRKHVHLTINTHGDVLPTPCDITYMHFPTFALLQEDPEVTVKYRSSLFWRLYFTPYEIIQKQLLKRYVGSGLILTNSTYSRQVIKRTIHRDAVILHPPVDVETFTMPADRPRENIVVTCSRLTPEKNLEIIPTIASKVPEAEFHIIGSTSKASKSVIAKIESEKDRLKAENVHIHPNASLKTLLSIYEKAKIYLHTMKGEHFGISVVEAMASALAPIVPTIGGPWTDITLKGKYGIGYRTPQQAIKQIKTLLKNSKLLENLQKKAQKRSTQFTEQTFKEKLIKIVSTLI